VDYAIRIGLTVSLLLAFRKRFQKLRGPGSALASAAMGAAVGVLAVFLWIGLLVPFQDPSAGEPFTLQAFVLRLLAAVLVVPFAEELLLRGYVLGLFTQWHQARKAGLPRPFDEALDRRSVHLVEPGAWTLAAVLGSSLAFSLGHSPAQWPAAFGFSLLMAGLWVARGDLVAPITGHAVTNLVLYVYVFTTGSWGLW
jgi:membrane protease YdiL (CAAX protease family)